MDLEKKVMVVGKGILFPNDSDFFEGFRSIVDCDYGERIRKECKFEEKGRIGPDDKVILSYIVFINPNSREVHAFLRDDERTSIYIRGPICQSDASGENRLKDPLKVGALNEVSKQVRVDANTELYRCYGFINLETGDYKERFGILYFALTNSKEVRTKSRRTRVIPIQYKDRKNLAELEKLKNEDRLDECSKAIIEPLKAYLLKPNSI